MVDRALPIVPGFTLRRRIGEGGMGVVFEAVQHSSDRTVALKLIREADVDPESIERLELEAGALARLAHPGVVPLLAQGRTETGAPWLALELIDGEPLDAFVAAHEPTLQQRLLLFRDLADAVAHAHHRGVIHRDLKPSNVLVASGGASDRSGRVGRVRVLDFGLARLVDRTREDGDQTAAGGVIGTVSTMSPEQARGDTGAVDQRSDVYSLGVILYQLLTRRPPIDLEGCWVGEAARRITTVEPRPPHQVARVRRDLSAITMKAIDKRPERRYSTAADLRDDIVRALDGEPVSATTPGPIDLLVRLRRRHPAAAAVALTLVLGLVAAGPLFAWSARRQSHELRAARDRARAVLSFQQDILSAADPSRDGRTVRVVDVLDRAHRAIAREEIESATADALREMLDRARDSLR